jgi:hypothetical protein
MWVLLVRPCSVGIMKEHQQQDKGEEDGDADLDPTEGILACDFSGDSVDGYLIVFITVSVGQ